MRFYASVPLQGGGGVAVGTLCAFDTGRESSAVSKSRGSRTSPRSPGRTSS